MRFRNVRRRTALAAAGLLATVGLTVITATPAHAAVACRVDYTQAWTSPNQFGANVVINNLGDPVNGWTLTFNLPNGRISNGWPVSVSQAAGSQAVTIASNAAWNASLGTGASFAAGFNADGSFAVPTSFSLNGTVCNGGTPPPTPTLVVTPTAVNVPEGSTATFGVHLSSAPASNTTVTTTAGTGDADLTASAGTSLTFTPANFATDQVVTLRAAEDADTTNGTRTFTVASSGIPSVSVLATEADNDVPPPPQSLVVTPTSLSVPEGTTTIYAVHLATAPTANVTVTSTAGTGDADLTVTAGASLTFTPANFAANQNVSVTAAEDADQTNGTRPITVASTGLTSVTVTATEVDNDAPANAYVTEFTTQYNKLKDPANGYFSPEGIPYHSVETLLVEAPDYGHETTSEAFSFWMWLEAQFGRVTGNWVPFNNAWTVAEQNIIPTAAEQPGGQSQYNPSDPADYAPEQLQPSQYPVPLDASIVDGNDPLAGELQSTYGNRQVYGMHWLLDVDDVYNYGKARTASAPECGDTTKRVTLINTFQRGPQESVWETVTQPSCEVLKYGQSGQGYGPLFVQGSSEAQWKYTDAPDADARAVQATYWALQWATAQGKQADIAASVAKAAKMGDFLRYSFFDKYFKNPGCASPTCTPGSGKSSSAYLLSWYYAWGGNNANSWAWRIGSSASHQGYQNPLAAFALSSAGPTALHPLSPTASTDWTTSLSRMLDFYLWLQSAEGAIAGGATNSVDGHYAARSASMPNFFGMQYDFQPVFHDPASNQWFGFQAWSMERVAEYYNVTGDAKAKKILDKWVAWAISQTTLGTGSTFTIPSDMQWTGAPAANYSTSTTAGPAANPGLHVTVSKTSNDVGVAAAYARTLTYYAKKENGSAAGVSAQATAKGLLDRMILLKANDTKGIVVPEVRDDYNRFDDVWNATSQTGLFVPPGFTGTMPNGETINSNSTFMSIRSFYQTQPGWAQVQAYLNGGAAPTFTYHRFWAQSDIAMAFADYGALFPPA